jgi:hypothetical protein
VRSSFLILLALSGIALANDGVTQRLNRSAEFLEARLKSDPEDFIAANRLCDTLLRRSRWTGRLDDWRRAGEVAELSLKSAPA